MKNFKLKRPFLDFVSLFFPDLCVACSKKLLFHERYFCVRCKSQLPKANNIHQRGNLAEQVFYGRVKFSAVASGYVYSKKSKVQDLLHRIKYAGQKQAAIELGHYFGKELGNSMYFKHCDMIIPVPIHKEKMRLRRYNQAEMLARGVAESMGIPLYNQYLKRSSHHESQTHKGRYQRWQNVQHDFKVYSPKSIEGKHILLIDDVLTTGATLESCARPLLEIPRVKLSAFTLAIAHKF